MVILAYFFEQHILGAAKIDKVLDRKKKYTQERILNLQWKKKSDEITEWKKKIRRNPSRIEKILIFRHILAGN